MKFTCNKEELVKGINIVIRAAYGKYQKSILECIHIVARDGRLTLDAFDTTTAIKTRPACRRWMPSSSPLSRRWRASSSR